MRKRCGYECPFSEEYHDGHSIHSFVPDNRAERYRKALEEIVTHCEDRCVFDGCAAYEIARRALEEK